ncbi:MAG: hypothetical protein L0338_25055 [Acidobacteria bacterium]|nr:hypothetical protein [Acidobacteriota bacterium]
MPSQACRKRYAIRRRLGWLRRVRETGGKPWLDDEQQERLKLKARIEEWIQQQPEPVLYRQGRRVDLLKHLRLTLDCISRDLILTCRTRTTRVRGRVVQATQDEFGTVALRTQLLGITEIFEIRPAQETAGLRPFQEARGDFQKTVERLIGKNFPKARILSSVVSPDLEHSLSGKYVRLHFQSGRSRWLAIAASPQEDQAAIDGLLSSGLLWRDFLKEHGSTGEGKLLLLAPRGKLLVLKSRLGWIRGAGGQIHLMEMDSEKEALTFVDLSDCGNLDTALTQVQTFSGTRGLADDERVQRLLALAPEHITWVRRGNGNTVGFRIRGLEFAQLQFGRRPRLTFGLDKPAVVRNEADWARLKGAVQQILSERSAKALPGNGLCMAQSERWLESLILRDIRVVDARLDPRFVYPQVPAFLGGDRGMIDILGVTTKGRLAILELKVSEDIELPMQGLDYWLRVRWHHSRREFQSHGYFPGTTLSASPPLLFFVCAQFRYHSSFPVLAGQIDPAVPMIQVGINENWREGVRVVLRREVTTESTTGVTTGFTR